MKDILQPMLGARVFLDSDNLKDIRDLFEGVRNSDALLLLATRDVLTRPYVLLELWTAANARIPVIVLVIEGGGFDVRESMTLLENLETALPNRNKDALMQVQAALTA